MNRAYTREVYSSRVVPTDGRMETVPECKVPMRQRFSQPDRLDKQVAYTETSRSSTAAEPQRSLSFNFCIEIRIQEGRRNVRAI